MSHLYAAFIWRGGNLGQIKRQVSKTAFCFTAAELDVGMPGYGGYAADMAMDGMDGGLMAEEYPGTLPYEHQPYA